MGFFSGKPANDPDAKTVKVKLQEGARTHYAVDEARAKRPAPKKNGTEAAAEGKAPADVFEVLAAEEAKLDALRQAYGPVHAEELRLEEQAKDNPALLSLGIDPKRDGRDVQTLLDGGTIGENDTQIDWPRLGRAHRAAIARQEIVVENARRATAPAIYTRDWAAKHREALEAIAWSLVALLDSVEAERKLAAEMSGAGCFPCFGMGTGIQQRPFLRLGPAHGFLKTLVDSLRGITKPEQLLNGPEPDGCRPARLFS